MPAGLTRGSDLASEMEAVMASSNHTNSSSVLTNLLHMEQKKALRFNNYSNPALELQEEIMASFYILIIVGFFGFLLFVMMLSNIVSSKPENYVDYLYSGKLELPQSHSRATKDTKDTKDTFVIINSAAFLDLQRQDGTSHPGAGGLSTNSVLRDV
ncbi:hypothetical protein DV515_00015359 [Chloebia gouldiae]|uniref:Uncharacterized protein n=1 Tax=Chloebia gouldiae TaxID=44316 RepID=A0A3L8RVK4_CHLGU|nr:hypothetical protein DV515_00015359 [Chloebia gouldiae]